jgi:hypothetical protein
LVLTIIFFHHPTLRAEAPVPRQRWEYAALMTSARLSKWTSRQSQYSEEGDKGYLQLYRDLGGKKPIQTVSLIDLLNLAGDDGWELVAIDGGDGPHQYLFKRAQA